MKPLLLDLFCGAGGATYGYQQAGFYVVGVDVNPQPHYCGEEFYQEDALAVLDTLLRGECWHGYYLHDFAAIHASPVCKAYTQLNFSPRERHEKLIPDVLRRLRQSRKPFVLENVAGAKSELPGALWLCGSMFGLRVWRHRLFESNTLLFAPSLCNHTTPPISIHGHIVEDHARLKAPVRGHRRYHSASIEERNAAMDIDWMNRDELAEAIPPAYTRWIGAQLMAYLANCEVAS